MKLKWQYRDGRWGTYFLGPHRQASKIWGQGSFFFKPMKFLRALLK